MSKMYKGYEIKPHKKEGFVIYKDSEVVCSQPSIEFACHWVDKYLFKLKCLSVVATEV